LVLPQPQSAQPLDAHPPEAHVSHEGAAAQVLQPHEGAAAQPHPAEAQPVAQALELNPLAQQPVAQHPAPQFLARAAEGPKQAG